MNNQTTWFSAAEHRSSGHGARRGGLRVLLLGMSVLVAPPVAAAALPDVTQLSLEQLLDVTIIGASKYEQKQSEVAAAVSVITRSEIKAFGWRTIDEALASLPGIHTTYDRQYGYIGTRGFGLPGDFNTRLLLTINGNRVNDVVYDAAISGRSFPVDIDLVERIEFIPGPGGAVYGQNALFGVVNVITRKGAQVDGAEVAVSYQDLHAARKGRATWGKTLDNGLDVVLSASVMKARGEDHRLEFPGASADFPWLASETGVARGMDGERDGEFLVRLARGPWSFDLSYGDARKDDPTAQYFSEPLVPGQYQRDRHLLTQLQYEDRFADDTLQFTARLFLGRERYTGLFNYADAVLPLSNPYLATGSADWQGLEMRLLSTAWAGHKVLVGLEVQDNSRRDQSSVNQNDPADSVEIPGSGWRVGVYAQDEWALGETLTATLGLRVDRNDVAGNALSPRAALIWKATANTTLKALYGRAHRAPNAFERDYDDVYSQVANPGLKSETVDTLELVLDRRVGESLLLRGSVYHWQMQGLVTLGTDSGSGLGQYQNGDDIRATGVEVSADNHWDWGGRLRGSLSYQDAAYESGARLANAPRLLGKLNFSGPLASTGVRFGYELQYSGDRQSLADTGVDGYWLSNLHIGTDKLAKGLEVSLGLYNLFDTRYEHPAAYGLFNWQNALRQDGRSARLHASYRF
jgi:outer membrane receptor protein involved in Fe transport